MQTFQANALSDLDQIAEAFIQKFETGVFEVHGEMGAGKTTFIATLCKRLGVKETSSPTFALVNEYETSSGELIYHFDLYRIKRKSELVEFGFQEYLLGAKYVFIEWPEVAEDYLDETHSLLIKVANGVRTIQF